MRSSKTKLEKPLTRVLLTDCGSTTTKALLFERKEQGWELLAKGQAPTTVENPVADVTVGALNSFREVEELSGVKIIKDSYREGEIPFLMPADSQYLLSNNDPQGIDLYLSTSSAGGGLQMLVAGVVKDLSTASANRAALGAGAIVLESFSLDDDFEDLERIFKIKHLKPDIFLLAGGFEDGAKSQVLEMAEMLLTAAPQPRFGNSIKLPVVYAGNSAVATEVEEVLENIATVEAVANVLPESGKENLVNAREAIHELFLSHVMSHSPGYDRLMTWASRDIIPTPVAVGNMIKSYAESCKKNILAVDIGGATTDVFSVFKSPSAEEYIFNRSVSANYGMSYSVANVLFATGVENISRWLPEKYKTKLEPDDLTNRLRNKMLRPTSIPQTLDDLAIEQAVCREALRLSLKHHQELAIHSESQEGSQGIAAIFKQHQKTQELVKQFDLDIVIGSGGVICNAPERWQAALMLQDGFSLVGITEIYVDSIFMLPHLGVLAGIDAEIAAELLIKECLVKVADSITPMARKKFDKLVVGQVVIDDRKIEITNGEVKQCKLGKGQSYQIKIVPASKDIDFGQGFGEVVVKEIIAGEAGLLIDGRINYAN